VLNKYYVREAKEPRNYLLSFAENGLFKTIQRRGAEKLKSVNKSCTWKTKAMSDFVAIGLCIASFFVTFFDEWPFKILMIFIAGQFAAWLNNISHNFIHQPNNWRMKMSNLVWFSWRDWRVFHAMVLD
jgi:hypothetical protein